MKAILQLHINEPKMAKAAKLIKTLTKHRSDTSVLCGALCSKLGNYYDGAQLLNAFYAHRVQQDKLPAQIIAFARAIALDITREKPAHYNDMDDYLWAEVQDGSETIELPWMEGFDDPRERLPNGNHQCVFQYIQYTVYHESHGFAWMFFVKERTFKDEQGGTFVLKTEFHCRRKDRANSKLRKTQAHILWKQYVPYGDARDPGFTFSGNIEQDIAEGEADLWAHNMWGEIQHFDAMRSELISN